MIGYPILAVSFIMNVVAVLFIICCAALILIILIQKGRGGGLSAAFGGGMASGLLGSKTGDFLTWVTIALVSVFLTLAVVMAKFYKPPSESKYDISGPAQKEPLASPEQPVPSEEQTVPSAEQTVPTAEIGDQAGDANEGTDVNTPAS